MEIKSVLALIMPNLCGLSDTKVVVNVKECAVWLEDNTGTTFKIIIEKVEN
jgi:hypothetical protein